MSLPRVAHSRDAVVPEAKTGSRGDTKQRENLITQTCELRADHLEKVRRGGSHDISMPRLDATVRIERNLPKSEL